MHIRLWPPESDALSIALRRQPQHIRLWPLESDALRRQSQRVQCTTCALHTAHIARTGTGSMIRLKILCGAGTGRFSFTQHSRDFNQACSRRFHTSAYKSSVFCSKICTGSTLPKTQGSVQIISTMPPSMAF
jgi:hypothetical protein